MEAMPNKSEDAPLLAVIAAFRPPCLAHANCLIFAPDLF
jgi:hypothetical protein